MVGGAGVNREFGPIYGFPVLEVNLFLALSQRSWASIAAFGVKLGQSFALGGPKPASLKFLGIWGFLGNFWKYGFFGVFQGGNWGFRGHFWGFFWEFLEKVTADFEGLGRVRQFLEGTIPW